MICKAGLNVVASIDLNHTHKLLFCLARDSSPMLGLEGRIGHSKDSFGFIKICFSNKLRICICGPPIYLIG